MKVLEREVRKIVREFQRREILPDESLDILMSYFKKNELKKIKSLRKKVSDSHVVSVSKPKSDPTLDFGESLGPEDVITPTTLGPVGMSSSELKWTKRKMKSSKKSVDKISHMVYLACKRNNVTPDEMRKGIVKKNKSNSIPPLSKKKNNKEVKANKKDILKNKQQTSAR